MKRCKLKPSSTTDKLLPKYSRHIISEDWDVKNKSERLIKKRTKGYSVIF